MNALIQDLRAHRGDFTDIEVKRGSETCRTEAQSLSGLTRPMALSRSEFLTQRPCRTAGSAFLLPWWRLCCTLVYMTIATPLVRLPAGLAKDLAQLDDKAREEANDAAVEALEDYLYEARYGAELKAEAEAVRSGTLEARPLDELTRELGFDPDELRARARAEVRR